MMVNNNVILMYFYIGNVRKTLDRPRYRNNNLVEKVIIIIIIIFLHFHFIIGLKFFRGILKPCDHMSN